MNGYFSKYLQFESFYKLLEYIYATARIYMFLNDKSRAV